MKLYNLARILWQDSQLIYHALAKLGWEALCLVSPATPYVSSVFIRMWSRKLITVGPLTPADKDEILIDPMKLLETAMADKDWLYQKAKAVIT